MSGVVSISEAPTTGLGKLLSENRFFVPTHQRDYRWNQERVAQLFNDLHEAMIRGDKFYFIGLMVFMRSDDGSLRVLDGQQRLATTIIILSAIRAWFGSNQPSSETANQIQRDFIGRSELGESKVLPKLSLNFNNDDRFQKYVVSGSPLAEVKRERLAISKNAPNYDMLSAIAYCHDRISGVAEKDASTERTSQYLIQMARFIRDNVIVVRLTVPNEVNAFRVFETLNDRGLDLSAVDLLKNYIFGLAHEHSTQMLGNIEKRWAQITQTISNFKQDDFLKVYWTSRHGRTQLDQIFEDVKLRHKDGASANDLSIDLLESADYYAAIEVPDDQLWAPYSPKVRASLSALSIIGSKQVKPVILSAVKKLNAREFERLLRLLETVIVRYQLIGEERTGALEIACAKLAQAIWSESVSTASEAAKSLANVYPSDEDFQFAFTQKEDVSSQKAQYLLRRIEEQERQASKKSPGRELAPTSALTTEHILPKNPAEEWEDVIAADPDAAADCALRLGNLCLLTEGSNRGLGRAAFSEKRKVYAASELLSTQQVATAKSWNRQEIEKRQAWLAKRAVAVWRFE